jgi:hypothetical protein
MSLPRKTFFSSETFSVQSQLDLEYSLDFRNWLQPGSDIEFAASIYQLSLPELELVLAKLTEKQQVVVFRPLNPGVSSVVLCSPDTKARELSASSKAQNAPS